MRNIITTIGKIVGFIALAAIIGFSMTGCDKIGIDDVPVIGEKTPLLTPSNVRVDHAGYTAFTLRWNAVEGADKYELDIDGELTQLDGSKTYYDLKNLTADPKVYPVRVRALAANGDLVYKDSAYSDTLPVEPAEFMFDFKDDTQQNARFAPGARTAENGMIITGLKPYGKSLEHIVIPPTIGSRIITAIGDDAFKNNNVMTSIFLPETIITIGTGAFSGTDIASIIIPESVTNIGDGAFSNCIALVTIVFVSVEDISLGNGVFTGSDAIESIVVPEGAENDFAESMPELAEKIVTSILTGIEISKDPSKTIYTAGETLNTNGIEITAIYSDGSKKTVTSGLVFSHTTLNTVGTVTITVTYQGKSAVFTVTVNEQDTTPPGTIGITVNFTITDAHITGQNSAITELVLHRNSDSAPQSAEITVQNSSQYGSDIKWKIQNTDITGDGASFIIQASNPAFISGMEYFVTVDLIRSGIPYSKTILLTIIGDDDPPDNGGAQLSVSFAITDAHITSGNALITELVLYRNSGYGPQSAEITVQNSSQYGSNIKWKIQNTDITGDGASFIIQASNQTLIPEMEYFVTVELIKGGIPYNKTILLTVRN